MRRLALVLAGGALWLILAAVPALADGGPHVMTVNNGSLGINADGCAGCHRAHTAQGPFLINAADETALCKTCHGAAVTGSTVDVMTGVQYALAGRDGGTLLGALRGGGYDEARLDAGDVSRASYLRNATSVSQRPKVGVGASEDVTSSHIAMADNGLTNPGVAWGNGLAGSGAGPAVEITCASCHNPHGNGQYRILNKVPEATDSDDVGAEFSDAWVVDIRVSYDVNVDSDPTTAPNPEYSADNIYTVTSHALLVGDEIEIAGHTGSTPDLNGTWFVKSVGANNFTISATSGGATVDITVAGSGGTVERISGVVVTDATLPTPGDTRNYTVMQVKGTEGTESTYLLYASEVAAATASGIFNGIAGDYTATGGDYFARNVPWNPVINDPTCDPTVNAQTQPQCATANSAPNARPSTFSGQITAWCASCHTRYFANNNPVSDPPAGPIGAAWANPRPGDSLFMYQHRTVSGRDCLTCHVSHGSNAAMTGDFSSTYTYPDGTASDSSRLLKVDNRGTCQACHDPTGTITAGTYIGPVGPTVP
ncbi:MAG TPA: cytochrome c3 family protein [Candidatus Limnocylindrales bacterium]